MFISILLSFSNLNTFAETQCKFERSTLGVWSCKFGSNKVADENNCAYGNSQGKADFSWWFNDESIYCGPNNTMYTCDENYDTTQMYEKNARSGEDIYTGNLLLDYAKKCYVFDPIDFGSRNVKALKPEILSPVGLVKTISNFLFYFAIFYFVLLMLINGFSYVRAAEDPGKLKEIKANLFNTIAGFLFVLLSGGLIISFINQIGT